MELEDEAQMLVAEVAELLLAEGGGVDAVDTYAASVRTVEGADDLQQRCLAGAAGADDAHHLATFDVEVDAFEHLE